ncbi:MAG: hypothetical protein AAF959_27350 [Cyanobacteria bacterium P01_D01_bin.56]
MQQKKVVKKRVVTADGQTIAEASSVVIISDRTTGDPVNYQYVVDVDVSPGYSRASS